MAESVIHELDACYDKIPSNMYLDILVVIRMAIRRITRWLLRNKRIEDISQTIQLYQNPAAALLKDIPHIIHGVEKKEFDQLKVQLKVLIERADSNAYSGLTI